MSGAGKAALSAAQRAQLESAIRARMKLMRDEIAEALRASGSNEAIGVANHMQEIDDQPVADLETALEVAALERDTTELRALEAAIARIDDPDFGRCADCAAAIPFARLEVAPEATRCVACQSARERGTPNTL